MNDTVLIYIELDGELVRLITNDFYRTEVEQFLKEAIGKDMETDDILDILEGSFPCSIIEIASYVKLTRKEYEIIDLQTGEVVDTVDFRGVKEFMSDMISAAKTLKELNDITNGSDYEIIEVRDANWSIQTLDFKEEK